MRLKTYIINLEKSTVRKRYMQSLLAGLSFLDIEFIRAIDGRALSEDERSSRFDYDRSRSLYGRFVNAGEVGCALSHRKVYETLLQSTDSYALVLEDDITLVRDLQTLDLGAIDGIMNDPSPKALMLSGDYWFYRKKGIVRLYAAVGAYAYVINRAAAQRILSIKPPCCLADDWLFYKRKGVKLYAVYPYMIDANMNMDLLSSDVKQDNWSIDRSRMAWKEVVIGYVAGFIKIMFKMFHHFEHKVRIIDNVIV